MDENLIWLLEENKSFCETLTYAPTHKADVWSSWGKAQLRVKRDLSQEKAEELMNSTDGAACEETMHEQYRQAMQAVKVGVLSPYFLKRRRRDTWTRYHIEVTAKVPLQEILEDNQIEDYLKSVERLFYSACGLPEFELWNAEFDDSHLKFMHQCIRQVSIDFINMVGNEFTPDDPWLKEISKKL